eukprot:CAMPEP_0195287084 /NCGR_PEP_ID=MMETSP0707-20130614/4297_1 /TAXON_ID=33640 /ORGANISM="Asterionellopsis glacialis, Strain CCMP134" /LENGTH=555 /DNA_ID=CAMNT_0040346809 /DNA_START=40 /DNA_END=1707 /DNA_ORIENTATION=+
MVLLLRSAICALTFPFFLNEHIWVKAQECKAGDTGCQDSSGLVDTHERCPVWEEEGYCITESSYMMEHCPKSCSIPKEKNENCADIHSRCEAYAELGECENEHAHQMRKYCRKTCDLCDQPETESDEQVEQEEEDPDCVDSDELCDFWSKAGECEKNKKFMVKKCPKSCNACDKVRPTLNAKLTKEDNELIEDTTKFGVKQSAEGSEVRDTLNIIERSIIYYETEAVNLPKRVMKDCLNRHELCSFWSAIGECENNKAYMVTNCAPACGSCDLIDIESRCPPLYDQVPALTAGRLNKMFENIIENAPGNRTLTNEERLELKAKSMPEYTVTVKSRPSESPATEVSSKNDKLPPWVIVFDDFITPEECQILIDLGYKYKYQRSRDVGAKKFDGSYDGVESTRRTSENAWCPTQKGCRSDDVVQRIHNRMGDVMGIDPENSEDLQLLKYSSGQFYKQHHDYILHQKDRQCGPRILTFFLYLSDVEEGGGTKFNKLDITVQPKRGRAVLWPSVLDSNPMSKDGRTNHEALPVIAGTKFAANGWIHMYNYVEAQKKGCT